MSIYDDAEAATADLARIDTYLRTPDASGRTALDRIRDAMQGHPKAASYDTDRVSASGTSDPTGNAAMRADRAAQDRKRLDDILHRIRRDSYDALTILTQYQPRQANDHERARTAHDNDPHCESCARLEIAKGVTWWVEAHTQERTTVADQLDQPMWLCRWCYDHVLSRGCKPNEDEVEQHRDGKRIRCPHPERVIFA